MDENDISNFVFALRSELPTLTDALEQAIKPIQALGRTEALATLALLRWDLGQRFSSMYGVSADRFDTLCFAATDAMFGDQDAVDRYHVHLERLGTQSPIRDSFRNTRVVLWAAQFLDHADDATALALKVIDSIGESSATRHIAIVLSLIKIMQMDSEDDVRFRDELNMLVSTARLEMPKRARGRNG